LCGFMVHLVQISKILLLFLRLKMILKGSNFFLISFCLFIYLFIYGLFKGAVCSLNYKALSDRLINKQGIRKDEEGSSHGLI
jgi:hypothetical protein